MSNEQGILDSVLNQPRGRRKDSPSWVDTEYCLEAMRRFAKEQAIAFNHYTEFVMKEEDWMKDGELKPLEAVYSDFIEHQKQQSI